MRRPNALQLLQAGTLALVFASAILGIMTLSSALAAKTRASTSLQELATFALAFNTAVALAEERRPLETALAGAILTERMEERHLLALRAQSDEAISRFERRTMELGLTGLNFSFLRAQLNSARARADKLLTMPDNERSIGHQTSIIRSMVSVSETFAPMLATVCRRVETADPGLGGQVGMVWLLASMHDAALRLPSEVLPYIASRTLIPRDAQMQALRLIQRIQALWDVGGAQLSFGGEMPGLTQSLGELRADYLGRGLPYLSRIIERGSLRVWSDTPPAPQILDVYEGTTLPIAKLRDLYLERMISDATRVDRDAMARMVSSIVLTALILTILPLLVWMTFRQMLRPLLDFRDQILAISERREIAVRPYRGSVPQVRSLFSALQTLKERERERLRIDGERAALAERLRLLSVTDELTGLLNRRGFDAARQSGPPPSLASDGDVALVTLDIDHFKIVNDTWGHKAGDIVLQAVSRILDTEVGLTGVVGRYGGEEFVVLLWEGGLVETQMLTERLRARIEATVVPIGEGLKPLRVTASFGIAFAPRENVDWTALHEYADEALYAAKMAGRNRVRITNRIVSNWAGTRGPAPGADPKSAAL